MNNNLIEKQSKAMALFMCNIFAKFAEFEKVDISQQSWNSLVDSTQQLLSEDYKNGIRSHACSNMLEMKKWDKWEMLFEFEGIPNSVLPENMLFCFADEKSGDVFVFNTLKAKMQSLGTFNMDENGHICFLMSYQNDKFDPFTSIANYAWMVSNQAKRFKQKTAQDTKQEGDLQAEYEKLFGGM